MCGLVFAEIVGVNLAARDIFHEKPSLHELINNQFLMGKIAGEPLGVFSLLN